MEQLSFVVPSIVIRLDPELLDNADLDIRYVLPDLIEEKLGGAVRDNGYDYGENDRMFIFMTTASIEEVLGRVLNVIGEGRVLDNDLAKAAVVAVSDDDRVTPTSEVRVVMTYEPGAPFVVPA